MSIRDDVILRVIYELVEALLRAVGLRRKNDLAGAEQALGDGLRRLGLSLELIETLDAKSLSMLVADPARRACVALALRERAAALSSDGISSDRADALLARADALLVDLDLTQIPHEVRELLRQTPPGRETFESPR